MVLNAEIVILAITFITIAIVFHLLRRQKRKSDGLCYPPAFPSLPLVGSLPFLGDLDNLPRNLMKKSLELGPIFTIKIFNRKTLVLNSRDVIVDAMNKHASSFSGREGFYTDAAFVNLNRKGIIGKQYDGEFKKYHSLSLNILKEFGFEMKSLMEKRILVEVENLVEHLRKKHGMPFDPMELSVLTSSNIIKNILLGKRHNYEDGMDEICQGLEGWIRNMDIALEVAPIFRFLPSQRKKLKALVEHHGNYLQALETEYQKILNGKNDDCFVRRYLEKEGPEHDHEQLIFTLRDLIVGGTDTIASSLCFLYILMANHPNIQNRLIDEIDSVVPKGRLPSLSDQTKMPHLEATLMEVWRFETIGPFSVAHLTLTDTRVDKYFVPAGTVVLPNLYAAHMNPNDWEDPDVFRPERFLDKHNNVIGKEKILPFGAGRRSCIGEVLARAEFFLIAASVLQSFFIKPPEGHYSIAYKTLIRQVCTPTPYQVRFIPRDK